MNPERVWNGHEPGDKSPARKDGEPLMDPDKMEKWLEAVKPFTGGSFWTEVFKEKEDRPPGRNHTSLKLPLIDLYQTRDAYIVLIDLPGVKREDVELSVSGDCLHIRGSAGNGLAAAELISSERLRGFFERTVRLSGIKEDALQHMTAEFKEGVLQVTVPKKGMPGKSIPIR